MNPPGRGVLIAVHNKFVSSLIVPPDSEDIEIICVKISLKVKHIYVLNCYVRPCSPITKYQLLVNAVDYLASVVDVADDILVVGDFNLPNLQWIRSDDESHFVALNASVDKEILLIDNLNSCGLQQISNIKNSLNRQLDLIFSSNTNNCLIEPSLHVLSMVDQYHPPLSLTLSLANGNCHLEPVVTYKFNFHRADFDKLNDLLESVNFDMTTSNDICSNSVNFYVKVFECIAQCVPYSQHRNFTSSPMWYTKELRSLRNRRNKFWSKYVSTNSRTDYDNYLLLYNEFFELSNVLYSAYLDRTQLLLKSNPKLFWRFINMKKKSDGYPSSLKFQDQSSDDPKVISSLFANFFRLAFDDGSFEPDADYFTYLKDSPQFFLSNICLDVETVRDKILKLKDDFSAGPDGLPAIVFKRCVDCRVRSLTSLFQLSLSTGTFPSLREDSWIILVFKKGNRAVINNYRPIAKLSCVPKLFECIIYDYLSLFCKTIISPKQHGFLKGKSTTTNLVEFVSSAINCIEQGYEVDTITTGFSQAFDKLSHNIIFLKLQALGFPKLLINWIRSYLHDCRYQVIFRSALSEPFIVQSGMPQGSHLGPLLFILTINDVTLLLKDLDLQIYADDMKLSRVIISVSDTFALQKCQI